MTIELHEYLVSYIEWSGRYETFYCRASSPERAGLNAIWALGDLIDIREVEEL